MKKKMLVTGSGGMVGHYVKSVFGDFDLILTDMVGDYLKLDVTDRKEALALIAKAKPDIVLHLAAATDVDRCQSDKAWAYKQNREGTKNVCLACKRCDATMVYMSSGSVFSGKLNRPARETDAPDPVNEYGVSKLAGEKEVSSSLKKFYITRAGWMMGGGPGKDKKFIGKIMQKIFAGENNLSIINDKFGSPTYAKDLLMGIKKLLGMNIFGIYHIVNKDSDKCSRYDMTMAIKRILKRDDLRVNPASSESFKLSAPRALSEGLESFRLKQIGLDFMRPWQDALAEYLKEDWGL